MAVSSIWKQIAPWVYEDANKKKKIQAIPWATFVDESQAMFGSGVAPTVTPPTTTTSATDSMYQWLPTPKVATKQNPVVDMSKPKPDAWNVLDNAPTFDFASQSDWQLQDLVARWTVNKWTLTQQDQFKMFRAQQELNNRQLQASQNIGKDWWPMAQDIANEEAKRVAREAELAKQTATLVDKRRAELDAQFARQKAEQEKLWQDTMSAAQGVLSFSWFGRSTYAAEKQADIQEWVNSMITSLWAQRDAELAKYEAERQWADALTLASMDENINAMKLKNYELVNTMTSNMNTYNQQNAKNMQEKLDNILWLAISLPVWEMTEEELAQAQNYWTLLIDENGNIDNDFAKTIPPKLLWTALQMAAEAKGAIEKKPETVELWDELFQQWEDGQRTKVAGNKKSQVQLEEITLPDGTKQTVQFDPTTGTTTPVMWWTTGDLRGLASQFPWQAWAKNNNPAWITWNNNFTTGKGTAALLDQAGIPYEIWTPRPKNEWWNYVSFPTIEDWLAAQRILMTQTYWNNTVQQMLGKWVWTWEALNYAKQVAWNAWVSLNATVNQLSDEQIQQLQMAKIKKESPWLAKLLWQWSNLSPLAQSAISSKTISWTPTAQTKVIEELQKAWEFDKWEGNANYFTTKADKKQEIWTAVQAFNAWDKFMNIYNQAKADWTIEWFTGVFDSKKNKAKSTIGVSNKTYNDMNRILQKELSTYMNKISWATVSETEVERLRQQIPNFGMWDKEFQDAVEAYNTSIRSGKNYLQNTYWLSDDFLGGILWNNQNTTTPSINTPSSNTKVTPKAESILDKYL